MFISYFDESGDDGYPKYSSPLFILTSIYMHKHSWKDNYIKFKNSRKELKEKYHFPVKLEMHTKHFLTDKHPYRKFKWDRQTKRNIIYTMFETVNTLNLKVINVVINKEKIKKNDYDIMDTALTYSIQRIENDLNRNHQDSHFLIITDEGRIGKMRSTARKIQSINYIPSNFSGSYNNPIKKLIEDPLPKNSSESYFIQISDMISYIVNLYYLKEYLNEKWANRVYSILENGDEMKMLDLIHDILNLEASTGDKYGIVHYPK
ncbi:MAG: DUF3800 domain-containing protein [Candidatus Cloacimonetes bacterium]|nr:DUF3800 domain-containing protein [Candidatus Cloacimonadota bacterium]